MNNRTDADMVGIIVAEGQVRVRSGERMPGKQAGSAL